MTDSIKPFFLWSYRFEESGGYDCQCPGVEVFFATERQFVIDAKDHGWFITGTGNFRRHGSEVAQERADVVAKIIARAQRIVGALNNQMVCL